MANTLKLELTVSGQLGKFSLPEGTSTYITEGKALTGPKVVPVPAAAAANSVNVCLETMSQQLVLLICVTEKITYQINGDGVNREIAEGAFAIHPGNPVITSLALGGNGLTDSEVSIFQVGKDGIPPTAPSGAETAPNTLHSFAGVTLGQTEFVLPSVPTNPSATVMLVEGASYTEAGGFFTLVDDTLTWLDTPFSLPAGARVEAFYQ